MNVNIIISLDVNMVKTATKAYKMENKAYWLLWRLFNALIAIYLKNPNSSRDIEIIAIEINKTNILIGLTLLVDVKASKTFFIGTMLNISKIIAPTKGGIKNVLILMLFAFIFGLNNINKIIDIDTKTATITE